MAQKTPKLRIKEFLSLTLGGTPFYSYWRRRAITALIRILAMSQRLALGAIIHCSRDSISFSLRDTANRGCLFRQFTPAVSSPPRKRGGSFQIRGAARTQPYIGVDGGKMPYGLAAGGMSCSTLPALDHISKPSAGSGFYRRATGGMSGFA